MLSKLRAHIRANLVGYIALFVATSGTAYAAATVGSHQIVDDSVRSIDLKNNSAVRSIDVVDDTATNGGLTASDIAPDAVGVSEIALDGVGSIEIALDAVGVDEIAPDAVGSSEIAPDAVGFSEIAASAFNADIMEQGAAFGIPNDGIQGFEVQDGTLSGADIDETTLDGVVKAQSTGSCCRIRGGILYTDTPYDALDPNTFIDLGAFELRSTATGDPDKISLCNPPGGVNFGASYTLYTGGASASTAETRSRTGFPFEDTCHTIDVNGATTTGTGDFRMWIVERAWEAQYVQGAAMASATGFTIFAISLH